MPCSRPNRIGASTLAALAAPPDRLEQVAALVSAFAGVNHNYEREHASTSGSCHRADRQRARRDARPHRSRDRPARSSGCRCSRSSTSTSASTSPAGIRPSTRAASRMRTGLPGSGAGAPSPRRAAGRPRAQPAPVRARSRRAPASTEGMALALIDAWLATGCIKRFGVVVRHRALGYHGERDVRVGRAGRADARSRQRLAKEPLVTLCYRRERALPDWPYNLFCMIHGRRRVEVEREIEAIRRAWASRPIRPRVLFCRALQAAGRALHGAPSRAGLRMAEPLDASIADHQRAAGRVPALRRAISPRWPQELGLDRGG